MTSKEFIQNVVKDVDPALLEGDFVTDMCAMHCDKPNEDEVIEFDDNALSLCKKDELFDTAKSLVREIAKFGMTCDTLASDRLHAFAKALAESRRDQYVEAGNKIEKLDQCGTGRFKSMTYALMTIGSIFSKDAFDMDNTKA